MDDIDKAYAELEALSKPLPSDDLLEIGHFATTLIVTRTKAGLDVDGHRFKDYAPEYKRERQKRGLSSKPDLAVTGQMLGALIPRVLSADEVVIGYLDAQQEKKAAVHNSGSDAVVLVKGHSRKTTVDKKGRRVSAEEARKDSRRKNKRTSTRVESVEVHERHMNTPKREFADIRREEELALIDELIAEKYTR